MVDPITAEQLERAGILDVRGDGTVSVSSPVLAEVVRRDLPQLTRRRLSGLLAEAAGASGRADLELRRTTWLLDAGSPVSADGLLAAARLAIDAGHPQLGERLAAASIAVAPSTEAVLLESWCADERGDTARALAVLDAHTPATDEARTAIAVRRAEQAFWTKRDGPAAAAVLEAVAASVADPWPLAAHAQQCVFDGLDGRCDAVLARVGPLVDHAEPLVGSTAALAATFSLVAADRAAEGEAVARAALARLEAPTPALFIDPGVHVIGLCFALHGTGALREADELTASVYRYALGRPGRQAQGWAAMVRAHVLAARGRPSAAVEAALEAEHVWAHAGLDGPARWSATLAALAHAEMGDRRELAASLARVERYQAAPFRLFEPETLRARAWLAHLDDAPGAVDGREAAAALARSTGRDAMASAAAHDLVRLGASEEAAGVLAALGGRSPLTDLRRRLATAATGGDGAELLAVGDGFDALGAEGWAIETRALAAPLLPVQAAALRREASLAAARSGLATPPLQRLVERPNERALTAREAEIVGLAASGMTNRAIADQLVVSLRTVENHLHRAFAKLGVSSRSELSG